MTHCPVTLVQRQKRFTLYATSYKQSSGNIQSSPNIWTECMPTDKWDWTVVISWLYATSLAQQFSSIRIRSGQPGVKLYTCKSQTNANLCSEKMSLLITVTKTQICNYTYTRTRREITPERKSAISRLTNGPQPHTSCAEESLQDRVSPARARLDKT